jgi:uncharacterized cupin superfamily protein
MGDMSERARELSGKLIRNFLDAETKPLQREPLYDCTYARLAQGTAAQKLGASIDIVAPGKLSCPYHFHHAQEEMFVILEGSGTLRVAGEMLPVHAGNIIFIPPGPEYPHQFLNTSDQPLKYLSISTKEIPEFVEYPDSGKYLAMAKDKDGERFDVIQRAENSIDYWDGEP